MEMIKKLGRNTCRNPGTSPTAVPSLRTQIISGGGDPFALHSTTAPVELEKSIRFSGSLVNTGPFMSFSLFDGAEYTRVGTSAMINIQHGLIMIADVSDVIW